MFIPLLLVGLGAAMGSRARPKSVVKKLKAFGPKTGLEYEVEKFPEADICVVRLTQGKACMALRRKDKKWWHLKSSGHERALKAIATDFDVQFEPMPEPEALST